MDQDQWKELSIRQSMSNESSGQDRYKRDLEDAQRLRSGMRTVGNSKGGAVTKGSIADDIELGLRALDEAERYRSEGELLLAKELYEKSLELLIRYIKDDSAGFDVETLRARVEVAFQDAEDIKQELKSVSQQRPSEPTSESYSSVYQKLSASLGGALKRTLQKESERQTNPQRKVSKPKQNRVVVSTRRNRAPAADQVRRGPQTNSKPAVADDPVKRVILSDFLVDRRQIASVKWKDIAGLSEAKQSLQETAILPLIRPDLFTGLRKSQNVLLWGPPGTGKTMLVRTVAVESGSNLFSVSASVLTSKWMGDSEKLVRTLFHTARELSPSIIFVDEMDSLLSSRKSDGEHEASRRLKTEFMVQTDGVTKEGKGVLVLACTNCPWDVDAAVMRRFPRRIYVPLPGPAARASLIKSLLKKAKNHSLIEKDISRLVDRTKGFSGSDISEIASEAAYGPLRSLGGMDAIRNVKAHELRPISYADFDTVIKRSTRSITGEQLQKYADWNKSQQV